MAENKTEEKEEKKAAKKQKAQPAEQAAGLHQVSLSSLGPDHGSRHRKKRRGCGEGSGHGKTSCRGGKGQTARSGWSAKRGFEGGQMPLHRRLPKVGFTSRKRTFGENVFALVSTGKLVELSEGPLKGEEITLAKLVEVGVLRSVTERVKVLGSGEVKGKLIVEAHAASKSAREAVERSGGQIRIVQ